MQMSDDIPKDTGIEICWSYKKEYKRNITKIEKIYTVESYLLTMLLKSFCFQKFSLCGQILFNWF
jgi:hypothetical protein